MIASALDTIVQAIGDLNTSENLGIRTIDEHAGKFTWDEFSNRTYNTPACFVSNLGFRELRTNEERRSINSEFAARFAIAVITHNSRDAEIRNRQGRLICEYLCAFIRNNNFSDDQLSEAYDVKCDPRFMAIVNDDGQALWVIDWFHNLPMCPTGSPILDDFDGVDIDHNNFKNPGQTLAETEINYTEE